MNKKPCLQCGRLSLNPKFCSESCREVYEAVKNAEMGKAHFGESLLQELLWAIAAMLLFANAIFAFDEMLSLFR